MKIRIYAHPSKESLYDAGESVMKIRIYAHPSKESLYDAGESAGLTGEALNYFTYFNEVAIDLDVDEDTGHVNNATIPWEDNN